MNKVELIGRLTRNPVTRWSQRQDGTQFCVARFSLAVDRRVKQQEGQQTADFPNCVAFGKTAEFVEKYLSQGIKIGITGRIQTGEYTDKDGRKVYTTEVAVEEIEFAESKQQQTQGQAPQQQQPQQPQQQQAPQQPQGQPQGGGYYGGPWMDVPPGIENDLPFR